MGSYLTNTPQTVMSIQVVAYTMGTGFISAGSIRWALYLETFNGMVANMDIRRGPFVPDHNDEPIRSRLCTIDYTPSNSYTPDDLWRKVQERWLEHYEFVGNGMGYAYWILTVFCLLEELGWVEGDTIPDLLDWGSYVCPKARNIDESWLRQGTFNTARGRQFAEIKTVALRQRLSRRLIEQRDVANRFTQMESQGQEWSQESLKTMASLMSDQLYAPALPQTLRDLIDQINGGDDPTLRQFHLDLQLRLQSPPIYVRSGSQIRQRLRDEIYKLLNELRQANRVEEIHDYFAEQSLCSREEVVRQMSLLGILETSIAQGRTLQASRRVVMPMRQP